MDFSGGAPSGSGGVGSLFATAPGARAPEDAETDEYTLFAKAYRGVKAGEKEALDPENGAAALWMRTCELKSVFVPSLGSARTLTNSLCATQAGRL